MTWVVICRSCHIELARVDSMDMQGGAVLDYSALRACAHVDLHQLTEGLVATLMTGGSVLPVIVVDAKTGRPREDRERLAAVHRYNILDTPPDGSFDRVAAIAARVFDVPYATVTIVDEDRIWFKAAHGLEGGEIDRESGPCASAVCQDEPWVVEDALKDPLALNNSLVRGELQLRFYAAAPITTPDGYRLGTVNVIGREPRPASRPELQTLTDLAVIVADALEVRLAAQNAVS